MYIDLTDYSEDHLKMFSRMTQDRIEALLWNRSDPACMPPSYEKWSAEISALREHHVHLLTAIGIVKEREKVNSN